MCNFAEKTVSCSCQYKHFCHLPSLNYECGWGGNAEGAWSSPLTREWQHLALPLLGPTPCHFWGPVPTCAPRTGHSWDILLSLTELCPLLLGVDEIPGVPEEACFSRIYLVFRAVNVCLRLCKSSPVLRMDSSALALKWSRPLNPVPFKCSAY